MTLCIAQEAAADELISREPFALLVGMLLDQQYPMEHAFRGPAKLAQRLGTPTLDVRAIAESEPAAFAELCATPPAVHRYGRSMGGRIHAMAVEIVATYDGDATRIWTEARSGAALHARLLALPGWGEMKADIFTALLGKQLGVQPRGWRQAAGPYAEKGSRRSVADVVDATTLAEVRAFKKSAKAAKAAAQV